MPEPSPSAPQLLKLLAHDLRWQLLALLVHSDYRLAELVTSLGASLNLVSYHLRQLRDAGLVHERRSAADERTFYYHLDVEQLCLLSREAATALHPAFGRSTHYAESPQWQFPAQSPRVLFLCTGNSARSQMAEALLREISGGLVEVQSAGSHPSTLHPLALRVMEERGIDMAHATSKSLEVFAGMSFDRIITLCDRVREVCPSFPGDPVRLHWSLPNPALVQGPEAVRIQVFRDQADQLAQRIRLLLTTLQREEAVA
jgi:ArsR family transcriptional regulator, arsenate/arsenite/antimonite-responsive transcriptional repressor / arsenate reductase (thioredoxin)